MAAIRSGDIIAFSGADWISDAINLVTLGLPRRGIHHVGIVSIHDNEPLIYEALGSKTHGRGPCVWQEQLVDGFQAHRLRDVLRTVPGKIYHLPLRCELYRHEESRLARFLDERIGRAYDAIGAARSGGLAFRLTQSLIRPENTASLFCSEACTAALVHVGQFQTRHVGQWSPNALCRALRRRGVCGEYRRLSLN